MMGLFYVGCMFLCILAAFVVMWRKVPTGVAGTIGLSLIALVAGANASDWFSHFAPNVSFQRVVLFYVGILFVLVWLMSPEMKTRYRRFWSDPRHDRRKLERRHNDDDSVIHPPERRQ